MKTSEMPRLIKGLDLGVNDYLVKPLDQNELKQGVPFNFIIRAPAPGAYVLQFYDAGRLGNEPVAADRPLVEVPMTLT